MLFRYIIVIQMLAISVSFPTATTDAVEVHILSPGPNNTIQYRNSTEWTKDADLLEDKIFTREDLPVMIENSTDFKRVPLVRSVRHMPNFLNKFFGGFGR